ncbi:Choline transport protein [Neolecta irregularis DAH-3]|uniref:Choline transport protein n=1 Tax=Neolecta irregularis (strain DAH-3) TaxID=1198029 RepID=A0A1U7LQ76_NEOID|nr:Choline transport protein [Neolecta irregularis DAH-3]|eukprot:OLL24815.1 Choline transport protein [Neolecta irregularis DAH-3]
MAVNYTANLWLRISNIWHHTSISLLVQYPRLACYFDLALVLVDLGTVEYRQPIDNRFALIFTFLGTVLSVAMALGMAPRVNSAGTAFFGWINSSGWTTNSYVFTLGIMTSSFTFTGFESVSSLQEEALNPKFGVAKAIICSTLINICTGTIFLLALLFIIPKSGLPSAYPVYLNIPSAYLTLLANHATYNVIATILTGMVTIFGLIASSMLISCSSKVLWSVSRESGHHGLFLLHCRYQTPKNAIVVTVMVPMVVIMFYFVDPLVFQTLTTFGPIVYQVIYLIPLLVISFRGRHTLPFHRGFHLGIVGSLSNSTAIFWVLFQLAVALFPRFKPVDYRTWNYGSILLFLTICFISIGWIWGREYWRIEGKSYKGIKDIVIAEDRFTIRPKHKKQRNFSSSSSVSASSSEKPQRRRLKRKSKDSIPQTVSSSPFPYPKSDFEEKIAMPNVPESGKSPVLRSRPRRGDLPASPLRHQKKRRTPDDPVTTPVLRPTSKKTSSVKVREVRDRFKPFRWFKENNNSGGLKSSPAEYSRDDSTSYVSPHDPRRIRTADEDLARVAMPEPAFQGSQKPEHPFYLRTEMSDMPLGTAVSPILPPSRPPPHTPMGRTGRATRIKPPAGGISKSDLSKDFPPTSNRSESDSEPNDGIEI